MYLTLSSIKSHINLDADFHDDDEYLIYLCGVAEDVVAKRIDRKLDDIVGRDGYLPPTVRQQILLTIAHFYSNREATTTANMKELPIGFDYLANLDKNYKTLF